MTTVYSGPTRLNMTSAQEIFEGVEQENEEAEEKMEEERKNVVSRMTRSFSKMFSSKSRSSRSLRSIDTHNETCEKDYSGETTGGYPKGYDKNIAKMLIDHSTAAYCPDCVVPTSLLECLRHQKAVVVPNFVYVQRSYNKKYDASAFCGFDRSAKAIVVSFRGTASLTNWKANLFALHTTPKRDSRIKFPPGIRVHQGFFDTYASVASDIVKAAVQLSKDHPDFQVYVTGHSMGGAQATFCCVDLVHNQGIKSVIGYTFGQPRVVNGTGRDFLNGLPGLSFYRIVNGFDPVPLLPGAKLGYHHVGQKIHFKGVSKKDNSQVLKKSSYASLEGQTEVIDTKSPFYKFHMRPMDHFSYAERYGARRVLKGKKPPKDPWDGETKAFRTAVAGTLEGMVRAVSGNKLIVVLVHAHWCKHCRKLWPTFKQLATKYRDEDMVQFIAIDGSTNDLHQEFLTNRFPTIFFKTADDTAPPEIYEGSRQLKHFEEALLDHCEYDG